MTRNRLFLSGLVAGSALIVASLPVWAEDKAAPPPPPPPAFEAMDSNRDGQISKAEFEAFRPPHCAPVGTEGPDAKGPPMGPPRLETLDTDHDGKLSWAEVSVPLKAQFDAADSNKNGFIDSDERPALPRPPQGPDGKGPKGDVLRFRHDACGPLKK
ncbi:hypothetical protein [Asticcacaulis sp.]|uniref:hypothetical protein n=1 Tax=Asticcacaulis sp. TaxID=1872648 RepID=UPI0031D30805